MGYGGWELTVRFSIFLIRMLMPGPSVIQAREKALMLPSPFARLVLLVELGTHLINVVNLGRLDFTLLKWLKLLSTKNANTSIGYGEGTSPPLSVIFWGEFPRMLSLR